MHHSADQRSDIRTRAGGQHSSQPGRFEQHEQGRADDCPEHRADRDAFARTLRYLLRACVGVVGAAGQSMLTAWGDIEQRDIFFEKPAREEALGCGFGFGKGLKPSCNDQRNEDLREAFESVNR